MKKLNESDKFELKLSRIEELIKENNEDVTWNDRINDPHNPSQTRQVDITVRNGNYCTHIECRYRNSPQDVKWVEELIGRKLSLNADQMIGVSNSGFTKGARLKADAFGIQLRDFCKIEDEEIINWGKIENIKIEYLKLNNLAIEVYLPDAVGHGFERDIFTNPFRDKKFFGAILYALRRFDKEKTEGKQYKFNLEFNPIDLLLSGTKIEKIKIRGEAEVIEENEEILPVRRYRNIGIEDKESIYIEQSSNNKVEFVHLKDDLIIIIDMSKIRVPENCIFSSIGLKVKKKCRIHFKDFVCYPPNDGDRILDIVNVSLIYNIQ